MPVGLARGNGDRSGADHVWCYPGLLSHARNIWAGQTEGYVEHGVSW